MHKTLCVSLWDIVRFDHTELILPHVIIAACTYNRTAMSGSTTGKFAMLRRSGRDEVCIMLLVLSKIPIFL